MKSVRLRTSKKQELVDLTNEVQTFVRETARNEDGAVLVFCPHTTAGIFINEGDDPDVGYDIIEAMRKLVPEGAGYRHLEGNAHAHIRSVLTGQSCFVPASQGRIALGTWQHIFFAEFDGPRERQVFLQFIRAR
jgi:secondary thiamine-phosphate synthase enzyme